MTSLPPLTSGGACSGILPRQTAANPVFTDFANRRPSTKPSRHRRRQDVQCVRNAVARARGKARSLLTPDFPRKVRREQRSEEHTSELQSPCNLVCRLLLEKKNAK